MTGSMRITAGDCGSPGHSKTSAEAVSDEFDRARSVLNGTFKTVSHGRELGFQGVVDHLGFFLPGSLGHGGLGFGRFFHRFFGSRFFAAGFLPRRGCLECLADRYLSINNARAVGRAGLWLPLRLSGQLAGHLPVTLVLTVG